MCLSRTATGLAQRRHRLQEVLKRILAGPRHSIGDRASNMVVRSACAGKLASICRWAARKAVTILWVARR